MYAATYMKLLLSGRSNFGPECPKTCRWLAKSRTRM